MIDDDLVGPGKVNVVHFDDLFAGVIGLVVLQVGFALLLTARLMGFAQLFQRANPAFVSGAARLMP